MTDLSYYLLLVYKCINMTLHHHTHTYHFKPLGLVYGKLDCYISMQDIFMNSFNTLLRVNCHVSPEWYIWLYCGGCLHECYWWFKQLGSEAFLITPAEEKVIIVDNTIIYHTILQNVPIRREPLSSFSRCYLSATNTSLFSVSLCVNVN